MKYTLILLYVLFFTCGCRKDEANKPKGHYTIQGMIYYNWDNKTPYAKQAITITVTRGHQSSYVSKDLATATTNDSGYFSASYDATDITGSDAGGYNPAQIHIFSQFFQFDGLPVNQNINKDFFVPTKGKIQIFLQTNTPLEATHDTLYLGRFAGNLAIIDTIIHANNGLYKTYTLPVGGFGLYYGRGWKQFAFNNQTGYFRNSQHSIISKIEGDPVVNTITINY